VQQFKDIPTKLKRSSILRERNKITAIKLQICNSYYKSMQQERKLYELCPELLVRTMKLLRYLISWSSLTCYSGQTWAIMKRIRLRLVQPSPFHKTHIRTNRDRISALRTETCLLRDSSVLSHNYSFTSCDEWKSANVLHKGPVPVGNAMTRERVEIINGLNMFYKGSGPSITYQFSFSFNLLRF
jgi:hypothetical protein